VNWERYLDPPEEPRNSLCDGCKGSFPTQELEKFRGAWLCESCEDKLAERSLIEERQAKAIDCDPEPEQMPGNSLDTVTACLGAVPKTKHAWHLRVSQS